MQPASDSDAKLPRRAAFGMLLVFLLAVLAALAVTLESVPPSAQWVAGVVVVPIVALALLLLYAERQGRRWAFAGAAALGALGVAVRAIVSTEPSLEVGGGLPIEVNVAYVAIGLGLAATSGWAFLSPLPITPEPPEAGGP